MVTSTAPLGSFTPTQCQVEPLEAEEQQLWPRPRRQRLRQAASAGADLRGLDGVAAAQGAADSEEVARREGGAEEGSQSSVSEGDSEDVATEADGSQASNDNELEAFIDDVLLPQLFHSEGGQPATALVSDELPDDPIIQRGGALPEAAPRLFQPGVAASTSAGDVRHPQQEQTAGPVQLAAVDSQARIAEPEAEGRALAGPVRPGARRLPAEAHADVEGGRITFYATTNMYTAQCSNARHGRCVMSRTALQGRRQAQGRPLGLLAGWLAVGGSCATKQEHWAAESMPSLEQRQHWRNQLANAAGGEVLLAYERPRRDGEGPESEQRA